MRCAFALTKEELISVFSDTRYRFVLYGQTNARTPTVYLDITQIPGLGHSRYGDKNLDERYLVVNQDYAIEGRKISRVDGSTVWAWDNLTIDAPIVCFGGEHEGKALIGELAVQAQMSRDAKAIYGLYSRKIQKLAKKLNGVNVGQSYLEQKRELTYSIRINPANDFRYD